MNVIARAQIIQNDINRFVHAAIRLKQNKLLVHRSGLPAYNSYVVSIAGRLQVQRIPDPSPRLIYLLAGLWTTILLRNF